MGKGDDGKVEATFSPLEKPTGSWQSPLVREIVFQRNSRDGQRGSKGHPALLEREKLVPGVGKSLCKALTSPAHFLQSAHELDFGHFPFQITFQGFLEESIFKNS